MTRLHPPARVKVVLGPTNTGKTHLAIERMLAHASGMIGFPLRLLARENYDRMVARVGARAVALVTGEEKIVPPTARWFSCTVEAMPLDRPTEFLAVDEIQLCADPHRGHVFTDRLLRARGLVETMFLGADTIRPLVRQLVPDADIETRPRLSLLRYAGAARLTKLPPRSAVVAFSMAEVYAIAEAIRRRRGGCAVVMGRLSPRTRNAQVALYQDREVDFLVATDAIGMGLNLDVDHVAFAGLSKFDGHHARRLSPAEVAQIAGRAGRGMRDGRFGTTAACPPMDDALVGAVEAHAFDRIEQICWRNNTLDFSGIPHLLETLQAPPPRPGLVRGPDASDLETLIALARDPEITRRAHTRQSVRLLWETCQIPDFRKLADESHARLCGRVFLHLADDGRLPGAWIGPQIEALARVDGDIDTLMQRLSSIRIWSYIAAHGDWLAQAAHWQDQARRVEDALSDALHEKLTARFVDRRAAVLMRRLDQNAGDLLSAVTGPGEVVVEGHPVGHVAGFDFVPAPDSAGDDRRVVLRAARRALRGEMPRRVALIETEPDSAFTLHPDHTLHWRGARVARLRPGPDLLHPLVEVQASEFLDGPQRERVRVRLHRFMQAWIAALMAPLFQVEAAMTQEAALRGPLHRLLQDGGVVAGPTGGEIAPAARARLKALGVQAGRLGLFMPRLMKPAPMALRAQLWALRHNCPSPELPPPGRVSLPRRADWPPGFAAAAGWVPAGPMLLRLDIAERVMAELTHQTRKGARPVPAELATRLSLQAATLPAVLAGLGWRLLPERTPPAGQFGPPAPPMIAAARRIRRAPPIRPAPPHPESPFAVLAALRL